MDAAPLTRNLPLKILALLLALVVFAHVQTEKEQETRFRVPLRLQGLSESLVLAPGAPRHAVIRVRGKGKQLLKLRVQPPRVLIDLREAHPGVIQRMLSATDVVFPAGTQVEVSEVLEPRMVEVTVDTLVRRTLPVAVVWEGEPATALAVQGPFEIDPQDVSVVGPARVLADLRRLPSLPLDLGDVDSGAWSDLLLDLPPGVRGVQSEAVRVRVSLVPAANRVFPQVPVRARGLLPGAKATLDPPAVELLVAGPPDLLASIVPESLRVAVDLEGGEPDRHGLAPAVQVPFEPQLRLLSVRPTRVRVQVQAPPRPEAGSGN